MNETRPMSKDQAYLFLKFYGAFMTRHEHVQIVDIDPARGKVELKIKGGRMQRWMSYSEAAGVIARSGR